MITKYETKVLQINKPVGGHQKGDMVKIKVDKKGTPKERYWRDRIKDSNVDECVEFVNPTVSAEAPAEAPAEDTKTGKKKPKNK